MAKITYPPEWSDKERMGYLLAPFPPADKPLSLDDHKFSFWSSLILSSCKELRRVVVSLRELQERFRWNGQTSPGCLAVVLENMERMGEVMKVADFYSVEQSWLSWGVNAMKKPVAWALKSYLPTTKYEGEYVVNSVTKECADVVLTNHQARVLYKSTDNLMKEREFEKLCAEVVSSDAAPLLANQLLRNGQLAKVGTEFGYEVIKLSPNKAMTKGLKVTDVDIGIIRIKDTIANLSEQVKVLEETIARLKQSAKEKLKEKDKKGALRVLRHSHSKRALLDSKEAMLDNVQNVLHKIQSAETDAMVFAAYKSGVEAISSLRSSEGLTLEAVEDVHAKMQELAEEGEEIAAVLGEGPAGNHEDDDELLRELEAMMAQEPEIDELEANMAKLTVSDRQQPGAVINDDTPSLADQLPSVPSHTLSPAREQLQNPTRTPTLSIAT